MARSRRHRREHLHAVRARELHDAAGGRGGGATDGHEAGGADHRAEGCAAAVTPAVIPSVSRGTWADGWRHAHASCVAPPNRPGPSTHARDDKLTYSP